MNKNKKEFDCIAFKREAQAKIYKDIKDLEPEDEAGYFHSKALSGPLKLWWNRILTLQNKSVALSVAEEKEDYKQK